MPYVTQKDKNQEIKIHYESVGKGEPIVFHHGNANCIKDWYTLSYVNELSSDHPLIQF